MGIMDKIYNLGIIGYGGMAGNHNRQLEQGNVRVRLKGVFDIDEKRLEVAKEQGHIAYSSKEELLNDEDIDIVLVATTNETHRDLAVEALRAGKHVICEKPVEMSVAALDEMIAAANDSGKLFTVHQNRRFDVDFLAIKGIVLPSLSKFKVLET